jgi:hypothetical protein
LVYLLIAAGVCIVAGQGAGALCMWRCHQIRHGHRQTRGRDSG